MTTNYELKDLQVKKHIVIARIIEVPLKIRDSGLLLAPSDETKGQYLEDYIDHPAQAEVVLVGPGCNEFFPDGINTGDIVYVGIPPQNTDMLNLKGQTYFRLPVQNITAVRIPKENEVKLFKTNRKATDIN